MKRQTTINLLCALAVMLVTLYLFPKHETNSHYLAELGKPWPYETLTAKSSFPIYKTQAQLEQDRERVLQEELVPCFARISPSKLNIMSVTDYQQLQADGYNKIQVVSESKAQNLSLSQVYTPRTAFEQLGEEHEPTLVADTMTTNRLRRSLIETVSLTAGMVQQGEKIIDRGEIVTERSQQVLASLRRTYNEDELDLQQGMLSRTGEAMVILIFMLMFVLYLRIYRSDYTQKLRHVLYFCTLPAILIIIACLEVRYTSLSIYLIPLAWVPVLTRIFFDSRTAFFLHLVTTFIISLIVDSPFEFILVQAAVGMVSIVTLRDLTRRSQIFRASALILLTYMAVYTAFRLATTGTLTTIPLDIYLIFAINALLVICSYALIYFFEWAFSLMSSITLIELTDFSSELLRRFSDTAPGSFQHSIQVSNLASAAAKAIGADTLLVRTGAIYHDVGKMARPDCYTENQYDGNNPLLEMTPLEAARVVMSHVNEGMALAHKYHLPEHVQQFILTHHGTSLVRYFYNTAVNHGDNPIETEYRYNGPKPQTKEQAILMMADAVEARSRSQKDMTEKALTNMVDQMINQQVADGQLAEADITFRDLQIIKEVFVQHILVMNHHRVKYPTIKR